MSTLNESVAIVKRHVKTNHGLTITIPSQIVTLACECSNLQPKDIATVATEIVADYLVTLLEIAHEAC